METWLYMVFIERGKAYNRMNREAATRHVENIRRLDDEGYLELCGVFKGYPGVAGMYILRAESLEAAEALARREPLALEGYATCKVRALQVANRENNYLL